MIKTITKENLPTLLPLLKISYPNVTLADELEYFSDEGSLGWCYFEEASQPTSFLRYFIQSSSPKFATFEFVINNNNLSEFEKLSSYCVSNGAPLEGITQRFELSEQQSHFIPHLKDIGFKDTTVYFTFKKQLTSGEVRHLYKTSEADFDQINEVFQVFQTFSNNKLKEHADQEKVHYLKINNKVVAVAWISFKSDHVELIEIATHPDYKKKGYAKCLLSSLESWAYEKGHQTMVLKVKEENTPAIKLYKSLTYERDTSKTEYWVYKNK